MNKIINVHYRTGMELIKKGLSDDALAIYISLRSLYNSNMEEQVISADSMYYQLYNKFISKGNASREHKWIKSALYELEKIEIISISEEQNNQYVIDLSKLKDSTEIRVERKEVDFFNDPMAAMVVNDGKVKNHFYKIELDQLQKVLEDNGNSKAIFRYYFMYLNLKAENKDMFYFMDTLEELECITKFDERSIIKYNKILTDNKLVYIVHYDYKYKDTGRTVRNLYTIYGDKEIEETNKSRDEFLKENLSNGKIYLSKSYANKGKDTKEFKEKLVEQQEKKVIDTNDTLTTDKKHFGGKSTVSIDSITTEPSEEELNVIEQEEKKEPTELNIKTEYKWWVDMIKNENLDMSQRIELAHKFGCEELLNIPKKRKEPLTFDYDPNAFD